MSDLKERLRNARKNLEAHKTGVSTPPVEPEVTALPPSPPSQPEPEPTPTTDPVSEPAYSAGPQESRADWRSEQSDENAAEHDKYRQWREEAAEKVWEGRGKEPEEADLREVSPGDREVIQYFIDNPDKLPDYLRKGTDNAKLKATAAGQFQGDYFGPKHYGGYPEQTNIDWLLGRHPEGMPDSPHYAAAGTFPEDLNELRQGNEYDEIQGPARLRQNPYRISERGDPTTRAKQLEILSEIYADQQQTGVLGRGMGTSGERSREVLDSIRAAYGEYDLPMPDEYSWGRNLVGSTSLPLPGLAVQELIRRSPYLSRKAQQIMPYNYAPVKDPNETHNISILGERSLKDIEADLAQAIRDFRNDTQDDGARVEALKKERDIIRQYEDELAAEGGF